jgi:hypothetical protein
MSVEQNQPMTLGRAITTLMMMQKGLFVVAVNDDGGRFAVSDRLTSYRGCYDNLAIRPGAHCTSGRLLAALQEAVGTTFCGYKGGNYTMTEKTPLWFADDDDCGPAVLDIYKQGSECVLRVADRPTSEFSGGRMPSARSGCWQKVSGQ